MGNPPAGLRWTNAGAAERAQRRRIPFEAAHRASRQAQALADPTRVLLASLVSDAGEACVGDLCLMAEREQSGVSRHLRILLEVGLLKRRSMHRLTLYSLSEDGQRLLAALLNEG